ncbi:MAG: hypothetical protein ACXW2X_07930, partial [Thermoanaerobaculia bacterium]
GFDPCIQPAFPPSRTISVTPVQGDVTGKFLFVPEEVTRDIFVTLRVLDLSRQQINWGTEIPVVNEAQAASQPIQLLDVAAGTDFRSLVRIYDFDPAPGHQVRARVFSPSDGFNDDVLLSDVTIPLRVSVSPTEYPGYGELRVSTLPGLPSSGSVRVEIIPVTEGLRFWAFGSVTNNITQHVTIVTPLMSQR